MIPQTDHAKDPTTVAQAVALNGDRLVWKNYPTDPRIAAVMTTRLRPSDIVIGKPCKKCGSEARYANGSHGCIYCNRRRKQNRRDFESRQQRLFD